jgi:transposase
MAKKQSSHNSVEVKLEAVRHVLENKIPVAEVAGGLGLHRDTVNRWVISFKNHGEQGLVSPRSISRPLPSNDKKHIRKLEKKLNEKELEIEILKKFQAFLKVKE